MKTARQVGMVLLLMVSYLTPAMACMVSDAPMNSDEMACCQRMQGRCGQMAMPLSHGCCQQAPQGARESALMTVVTRWHPAVWLASRDGLDAQPAAASVVAGWGMRVEDSPPQSPPGEIFQLRI